MEYIIHDVQTTVPQTVSHILRHEGLGGFWKGNAVNILRTAPFKAANFYAFDFYRKAFLTRGGQKDLTNWERIAAGAAAGATATLVCFPLDTVSPSFPMFVFIVGFLIFLLSSSNPIVCLCL